MLKIKKHSAFIVVLMYLIFTMLIFNFGVITWEQNNTIYTSIYFVFFVAISVLGYILGYSINFKAKRVHSYFKSDYLLLSIFAIHLFSFFMDASGGGKHLSLDIASNYYNRVTESYSQLGFPFFAHLSALTFPSTFIVFAKVIFNKSKICIFATLIYALVYILFATNSGIMDAVILSSIVALQVYRTSVYKLVLPFSLFLAFFGIFTYLRLEGMSLESIFNVMDGGYVQKTSILYDLPFWVSNLTFQITSYLTQGYYHFDKLFDLDFDVCFVQGSSLYFQEKLKSISMCSENSSLLEYYSINYGLNYWWSNFTWLISGFGYYAMFGVVFLFSLMFGVTSHLVNKYGNVESIALLLLVVKFFVYFPFGNQLFQNAPQIVALLVVSGLCFFSYLYYRVKV